VYAPEVDEATITTFQKAMDAIVADGTHTKLTAKYH
jgi:hypothetical protein